MAIKNSRIDKMRYQKNTSAYTLVLVAMIFQTISLFSTITPSSVIPSLTTAIEILINITLLLFTFLAAEKVKTYSKNWAYGLIVISFVHFLRLFYEPLKVLRLNQISGRQYGFIVFEIVVSIAFLVIASVITIDKHQKLMTHLKGLGE